MGRPRLHGRAHVVLDSLRYTITQLVTGATFHPYKVHVYAVSLIYSVPSEVPFEVGCSGLRGLWHVAVSARAEGSRLQSAWRAPEVTLL